MKKQLLSIVGVLLLGCLPTTMKAQFPLFKVNEAFLSKEDKKASDFTTNGLTIGEWDTNFYHGNSQWVDLDNDGQYELIAIGSKDPSNAAAQKADKAIVMIWDNNGDGTFTLKNADDYPFASWTNIETGKTESAFTGVFACIDYNNDGNVDILEMGINNNVFDNMDPSLSIKDARTNAELSANPEEHFMNLYKNNGDGTFTLVPNTGLRGLMLESEDAYQSVILPTDLNRDGYTDIVVVGRINIDGVSTRLLDIYQNNGDGTFTLKSGDNLPHVCPCNIGCGDYNKDGYPDLAVSGYQDKITDSDGNQILGAGRHTYLLRNDGDFNFTVAELSIETNGQAALIDAAPQSGEVEFGDFDNDGWLDILVTGRKAAKTYYTYLLSNKGNNCGEDVTTYPALQFERKANKDNIIAFARNSTELVDINSDGKLDIFTIGENAEGTSTQKSGSYIGLGNNDFTFNEKLYNIDENNMGRARAGVTMNLCDYDNDGFLDYSMMGYTNSGDIRFLVFRNTGLNDDKSEQVKNTAPTAPENITITANGNATDIAWSAGSDNETPVNSLLYNVGIQKTNGETFFMIPADLTTGKSKVSDILQAINDTKITFNLPKSQIEKVYVQTIDLGKMSSPFASQLAVSASQPEYDLLKVTISANEITVNKTEEVAVNVYDLTGKLIVSGKCINRKMTLPALKGNYIIKAADENQVICKKICL